MTCEYEDKKSVSLDIFDSSFGADFRVLHEME